MQWPRIQVTTEIHTPSSFQMFKSVAVEEETEETDDECSIEKVGQREEEEGVKEVLKVEEDTHENPCDDSFSSEALRYARDPALSVDCNFKCIFPPRSIDAPANQPEYCNVIVNNLASGDVVQTISSSSSDEVSTTEDEPPKSKVGLLPPPPPPPQRKSSISSTSVTSSSPDLNSCRPKEKEPASLGGSSIPGIPTPGKGSTDKHKSNLPDFQ